MRRFLMPLAASFVAVVAAPSIAAAQDAVVTADLNMRAGPSTSFPVVDVVPERTPVDVHGCLDGYSWCDVSSQGNRGWVSANYLSYAGGGGYVPLIEYTSEIEIPIITYSVGPYWDTYYRNRPWYGRRALWNDRWRDNWRDIRRHERVDVRRDRREDRVERRENRREIIQDRRRDARPDRREERVERRSERRVNRVEPRQRPTIRQDRSESRGIQRRQDFGNQRSMSPRSAAPRPSASPQRSDRRGGRGGRDG
jgi:uncharacterized protein YraI